MTLQNFSILKPPSSKVLVAPSGVTDGGEGGQGDKCPPGSSNVGSFLEMGPPLNSAPLLPKQLVLPHSVLQSFAQGFF